MNGEHWYQQDGSPFYSIIGANGKERPVTLRDARKVNAVPSVTTVLSVLAKPALTTWMVKQGIMAALTLPRVEGEPEDSWIARIMGDSKEEAKAAAEEGTRIHDALEWAFKGQAYPSQYAPHVAARQAEDYFCHASGFGGKVDLHSPSTGIVVDYKGKAGDFSDGKKLAYDQNEQ